MTEGSNTPNINPTEELINNEAVDAPKTSPVESKPIDLGDPIKSPAIKIDTEGLVSKDATVDTSMGLGSDNKVKDFTDPSLEMGNPKVIEPVEETFQSEDGTTPEQEQPIN